MFFESKNRRKIIEEKNLEETGNFSRWLFYFLSVVFWGVAGYVALSPYFLKIEKISIEGLDELEYETVLNKARSILEGKYFNLIAKNNFLLIRSSRIENELANSFKKIKSVKAEKFFPDAIVIKIEERKALLVWCSGEECYMTDENGYLYAPADFESSEVSENNLIVIKDESSSPVFFDRPILNPKYAVFLSEFKNKAKDDLGIEIGNEFKTPRFISSDMIATTGDGWNIFLNGDLGADREIEMLKILINQSIDKEKIKDLDYIDIRMENKVYYKLKTADQEKENN